MERKLLIVDDNPDISELIEAFVAGLFDKIDSVQTVDQAISILSDNVYDLIFLDINLANRNGAEVVKFLIDSEDNQNFKTPLIINSGIITPQFIDKYSRRFASILMKPFTEEDIREITEKILGLKKDVPIKRLEEVALNEIAEMKCELPFTISQLERRVQKRLEQFKKSKAKISDLKIDRNTDNYYSYHTDLLVHISLSLAKLMEWNTDKTFEKFIYASYLHDLALVNKPEFQKISSLEKLESMKDSITPEEYRYVLEHPSIAANSIEHIKTIPSDVDTIIRQHHELPGGDGFPRGCAYNKIVPLSAVFIVAHDLTEYILDNPKFTMDNYIACAQNKFHSSLFIKIFQKLPRVK